MITTIQKYYPIIAILLFLTIILFGVTKCQDSNRQKELQNQYKQIQDLELKINEKDGELQILTKRVQEQIKITEEALNAATKAQKRTNEILAHYTSSNPSTASTPIQDAPITLPSDLPELPPLTDLSDCQEVAKTLYEEVKVDREAIQEQTELIQTHVEKEAVLEDQAKDLKQVVKIQDDTINEQAKEIDKQTTRKKAYRTVAIGSSSVIILKLLLILL